MKTYQQLEKENDRLNKMIKQASGLNEKLLLLAGAYLDLSAESKYKCSCERTEKMCHEIQYEAAKVAQLVDTIIEKAIEKAKNEHTR